MKDICIENKKYLSIALFNSKIALFILEYEYFYSIFLFLNMNIFILIIYIQNQEAIYKECLERRDTNGITNDTSNKILTF